MQSRVCQTHQGRRPLQRGHPVAVSEVQNVLVVVCVGGGARKAEAGTVETLVQQQIITRKERLKGSVGLAARLQCDRAALGV